MKTALAALLLLSALPCAAQDQPVGASDAGVGKLLDQLQYKYEVDEDGDYKLLMEVDAETERSQLVFVRSAVERYGNHRIREIWSYGWRASGDSFPAVVANRLLEASNSLIMGGWVKQGQNAVFVVKIPADAGAEALDDAIGAAVRSADEMERELAADPASDEY